MCGSQQPHLGLHFPFFSLWRMKITKKEEKKKEKKRERTGNSSRLTADRTEWELPDDTDWKSGCPRICCVEMPTTNVYLSVKPGELLPLTASAVCSSWVRHLLSCQSPCFANAAFADRAGCKLGGDWMSTMLLGCWVTKKCNYTDFTGTSVNSTLNASGGRVQDLPYCTKFEGVNRITKKVILYILG